MNKQEKIDKIYEVIADKTLSFGCKIIQHSHIKKNIIYLGDTPNEDSCMGTRIFYTYEERMESPYGNYVNEYSNDFRGINKKNEIEQIIGHPVMIGDCDKLIEKGPNYFEDWILILDLWIHKTKPIEDQSDECVEYIYNLIKG